MKLKEKDAKTLSQVLLWGAIVSVVFAAIGYLGSDIWLASTQWLLVAAVMLLFSVYLKKG